MAGSKKRDILPYLLGGTGLLGLVGGLFGGGGSHIPMPSTKPPYTSPYLGSMDTLLNRYLSGMLGAFLSSGWGMPAELMRWFPKSSLSQIQSIAGIGNPTILPYRGSPYPLMQGRSPYHDINPFNRGPQVT